MMQSVTRFLYLALVAGLVGCGPSVPQLPQPVSSSVVGAETAPRPLRAPVAADRTVSGQVIPQAANNAAAGFVHFGQEPAGVQTQPATTTTGPGDVTLNFANADIREVAQDILGKILGLNYEIDPKVQGAITLQTSQPLARDAVLPVLESTLAANGIALVKDNGLYRVMPLSAAPKGASIAADARGNSANPTGYGVEVIPLRYASADALKRILEPFVPTGGVLRSDTDRNLLIVSGAGSDRASFARLVATFDIDSMAGMSFGMFPLKQGDATTAAHDLEIIMHSQGHLAANLRIVPIERTNSVLLVSPEPKAIDRAREWLMRLDQGPDEASSQLYVYFAQNARATDLAKVLSQAFGAGESGLGLATAPGTAMAKLAAPPASASTPPDMNGPGGPPGAPPGQAAGAGNAPASNDDEGAGTTTEGDSNPAGATGVGTSKPGVRIIADDKNNALVIRCRPADYRLIEAALKRLDVLPQQILIEATVAEVTLNRNLSYGLQWFFQHGNNQLDLNQGTGLPISQFFPGFNWVLGTTSAQTILSALSTITDVNVVSAPQLMVLDHHQATIEVGDSVPIATQQAVSVDTPNAPVVSSIQQEDTGVILQVTPRINNNGTATLDIEQEVSQAEQTTSSAIDSPTISKRKISTEVSIADGQTIALGGMIQDQTTKGNSGIPFLSQLPVMGTLFGTTTAQRQRTELLILLTPRIIHDSSEARDVTEELRQRLNVPDQAPPPPSPVVMP